MTCDEDSWAAGRDRIAGRLWVTTQRPGGKATRTEVLFAAADRSGRILRLTELTRPDPGPARRRGHLIIHRRQHPRRPTRPGGWPWA